MFARCAGIHPSTLQRILQAGRRGDKCRVHEDTAAPIARILGVPPEHIFKSGGTTTLGRSPEHTTLLKVAGKITRPFKVCKVHFVQLPLNGHCDRCGD